MDILFPLLFAAVAYLVPKLGGELWKVYQSRIAKCENFVPNVDTSTITPSFTQIELEAEVEHIPVMKQMGGHSASLPPPSPLSSESKSLWAGKMDGNAVIQGMIFAEIIQPPRAYRPFVKRK